MPPVLSHTTLTLLQCTLHLFPKLVHLGVARSVNHFITDFQHGLFGAAPEQEVMQELVLLSSIVSLCDSLLLAISDYAIILQIHYNSIGIYFFNETLSEGIKNLLSCIDGNRKGRLVTTSRLLHHSSQSMHETALQEHKTSTALRQIGIAIHNTYVATCVVGS